MDNGKASDFIAELFNDPQKQFLSHLSMMGNERVIFSGKFGIGKTRFLSHFFSKESQETELSMVEYEAFHLFPVNYSISATEDIYKFLKYDIIDTILLKQLDVSDEQYNLFDFIPSYAKKYKKEIALELLTFMPKIGKSVSELLKVLETFKAKIEKFAQENTSEGEVLAEFQELIESQGPSWLLEDSATTVINSVLNRHADKNKIKNVLIIDDLDRIDPEHVFRILNVFAAHLNHSENRLAKLAFDKIIIVCDIDNLRSIFQANYGIKTDFNGYIDKFYSHEIFHLDNRKIIKNICKKVFMKVDLGVQVSSDTRATTLVNWLNQDMLPLEILETFSTNRLINLRILKKKLDYPVQSNAHATLKFPHGYKASVSDYPMLFNFLVLKDIVGGFTYLKELLSEATNFTWNVKLKEYNFNQMLYFIASDQTLATRRTALIVYKGIRFKCPPAGDWDDRFRKVIVTRLQDGQLDVENVNDSQYRCTDNEFSEIMYDFISVLEQCSIEDRNW